MTLRGGFMDHSLEGLIILADYITTTGFCRMEMWKYENNSVVPENIHTPPPLGKFHLVSHFLVNNWAFETPLPLGISKFPLTFLRVGMDIFWKRIATNTIKLVVNQH